MAVKLSISVKGNKELEKGLKKLPKLSAAAMGAGIYAAGQRVIGDAKKMTPVDRGFLRGSGYATVPKEKDPRTEIGFGGPAQKYAVDVHERTEVRHAVGQAKFLEKAVNDNTRAIPGIISKHGKAALQRGVGAKKDPGTPDNPWKEGPGGGAA